MSRTALIVLNILLLLVIASDYMVVDRPAEIASSPRLAASDAPASPPAASPPATDPDAGPAPAPLPRPTVPTPSPAVVSPPSAPEKPVMPADPRPLRADPLAIDVIFPTSSDTRLRGQQQPQDVQPAAVSDVVPDAPAPPHPATTRPTEAEPVKRTDGGPGRAESSPHATPAVALIAPKMTSPTASADVRRAQALLARLGFRPGPADGVAGPQTQRAVRDFQARTGASVDGEIDGALLTRLERAADSAPVATRVVGRIPGNRGRAAEEPLPSWLGSLAGGIQRLLGHTHNSISNGGALARYCRANSDTWIYDEGRRSLVFCADVARSDLDRDRHHASR